MIIHGSFLKSVCIKIWGRPEIPEFVKENEFIIWNNIDEQDFNEWDSLQNLWIEWMCK